MSTLEPTYLPSLSFYSVNQEHLKKVISPYIKISMLVLTSSALGSLLPKIWKDIPLLMDNLGLKTALETATPLFLQSLLYTLLGFLFCAIILTKLIDAQFILSFAKSFLLVGLFFVICGVVSLISSISNEVMIQKILLIVFFLMAICRFFLLGLMRYYWTRKCYGDFALEFLVLLVFIGVLWKPISSAVMQ
jgi:hypothetical protein